MTAPNDRSNHEGIFLPRVIECPVCGEKAPSPLVSHPQSYESAHRGRRVLPQDGYVCRVDDARYAGGYGSLAPGGGRGLQTCLSLGPKVFPKILRAARW